MTNFVIELGAKVKSNISGFKGMAVGRAYHLHGCNRYLVQPPVNKDGTMADGYWFDELELDITNKPKAKKKKVVTGGPASMIK